MKMKMKQVLALALCAALLLCGGTTAAFAKGTNSNPETRSALEETTSVPTSAPEAAAGSKEETVYVLTDAAGEAQKIIVSDKLTNAEGADSLNDRSELQNIENVNGDETYQTGSDNQLIWNAQGRNICYQGTTDKELPIALTVRYRLDGKDISPEELAGKSGKVTIRFDYTNRQYETVEIDGKQEKVYVPFAVLTGMLLDNESFRNVEVTNGKLIDDGNRTVVLGLAFPGLQETLALDSEKLEIPDFLEITADATDFSMGMTVTLATNEIFNGINTEKLNSVEDLHASLTTITDAMQQLMDGSSALYDGLCTLLDKSGELTSGVDALASGAGALKNGASALQDGAGKLQSGAAQLYNGLSTLTANNATLNGGATQVFETLLSTATTQLQAAGLSVPQLTIGNYAEVLSGVIDSLDENAVYQQVLAQVTAAVEEKRPEIETQVTAAVQSQVTAQVTAAVQEQVTAQVREAVCETVTAQVILAATGMDQVSYDAAVAAGMIDAATQEAIQNAISAQMESDEVQATVTANVEAQMASEAVQETIQQTVAAQMSGEEVQALIAANTEQQVQQAIAATMASDEIQARLAAASEGAKTVIALKTSLDSYSAFYLGLQSYTAGVAEAANGAASLQAGAAELQNGASSLSDGASALHQGSLRLKDGIPALTDGIQQLRDGAMQLSDGLEEFNEEGIEKLVDAVDGDLEDLLTCLRTALDASKRYQSFSGMDDSMDGTVKFIFRTDSIGD